MNVTGQRFALALAGHREHLRRSALDECRVCGAGWPCDSILVVAAYDELRRLMGGDHVADHYPCTCTVHSEATHEQPAEMEQDPWCPTHPDMVHVVLPAVERIRALVAPRHVKGTSVIDGSEWCCSCDKAWPCPTVAALDDLGGAA